MPVGVIDSGVGGLSVVKELKRTLPGVPLVYLGDNARVPYGTRSPALIRQFTAQLVDFFQGEDLSCLLVACHTISTCALKVVQSKARWPVLDIVSPTIDYLKHGNFRKILLLGTPATVSSGVYKKLLEPVGIEVRSIAAPLLVSLAEHGPFAKDLIRGVLSYYLKLDFQPDAVVLGCTHFPVFEQEIQSFFPHASIINPAVPMVQLLQKKLASGSLLAGFGEEIQARARSDRFYFTDLSPSLPKRAGRFLGETLRNYAGASLQS